MAPGKYALLPATAGALEHAVLEQWRTEHLFARTLAAAEGRPEFVFYEGPPTANGLPGHAPRVLPHHQGPVLPPPCNARVPCRAKSGMGYSRTSGRDRSREVAGDHGQGADRGVRRRALQRVVPRERLEIPRGVGAAQRTDRVLAGFRRSVRHVRAQVRGERVVGARDAVEARVSLRGAQDPAVLPALRDRAVESRSWPWDTATSRTRASMWR